VIAVGTTMHIHSSHRAKSARVASFSLGAVLAAAALCGCSASTTKPVTAAKVTTKTPTPAAADASTSATASSNGAGALALALAEPLPFETFGKASIDRRARIGESRTRHKTIFPFDVGQLPTSTVKAAFKDEDAPKSVEGAWAKEVVAKRNVYNYGYGYGYTYNSVSIEGEGFTSGSVRIGAAQGMFYRRDGNMYGGVSVMCGPNEGIQSARWEGLVAKTGEKATDASEATYEIVDGWFDRKACKAVAVRRQTVKLKTVVPETLYAFRDCDEAGCDAKTTIGLVIPFATAAVSQNEGTVLPNVNAATRILVPVRRGGSEAIMASTYRSEPGSAYYTRTLSVEIVQGTSDDKPFATAFVEDPH